MYSKVTSFSGRSSCGLLYAHLKSSCFLCLCKQLLAKRRWARTEGQPVQPARPNCTPLGSWAELRCPSSNYQNSDFSWTARFDSHPKSQQPYGPWVGWRREWSRAVVPYTAAFFDGFAVAAEWGTPWDPAATREDLEAESHYPSANTAELVTTTPRSNLFPSCSVTS